MHHHDTASRWRGVLAGRAARSAIALGGVLSTALAPMAVVAPASMAAPARHARHHRPAPRHAAPRASHPTLRVSAARGQTIGHAVAAAKPGDTIAVSRGTYRESVTIDKRLRLLGHDATIDATGKINGVVVSGARAAGSEVRGLRVEGATGEGILVESTSHVLLRGNDVEANDEGHDTPATPECMTVDNVPGDCGEALHLMGVTDSVVASNLVAHNVGGILVTDETGPSRGNRIVANVSRDNLLDCGITLPSHNPEAVAHPDKAGVYDNLVEGNVSVRNGGAGVGVFAPSPGTAAYDNRIIGNTTVDDGMAGIAIHAHASGQKVSGNVIARNRVAGNGTDPAAGTTQPTGISLFSAAVPVEAVVAENHVSDEFFGVFINGPIHARGLATNHLTGSTVPVGHP